MQNTKIQALWQLCQELKNRRETLVEKMQQNQKHLDEQQWAMNEEVQHLKQQNQSLFDQVGALIGEVHHLQSQMVHSEPVASSVELPFSEGDLLALHSRYTELANQLDLSESLYQSRGALIEQLQKTNQHVHYEFKALKEANSELSHDLEQLQAQTNQLIELVENYRQAALEAYAEVEKMQQQQETVVAETENAPHDTPEVESQETFDSKAEAARDAVRKKIVILLRHRLGKVPRDVSSALKNISNSKTMDQMFELAMNVEDMDAFSAELA